MNDTKTVSIDLPSGNFIQFFANLDTGLIVVDLIHKNEKGGNEIFRRTIDERKMLAHCK